MAADIAGLIEAVAKPPLTVIGFSMGALVTQELLLARPDLCSCAALLGTLGRKDVFRKALFEAAGYEEADVIPGTSYVRFQDAATVVPGSNPP
jgi:pimeloyl-ACP methyl ester carboxylesterase